MRREISFTLKDDIYIRYLSYPDGKAFQKDLVKRNPYKLDIGAVFNAPVRGACVLLCLCCSAAALLRTNCLTSEPLPHLQPKDKASVMDFKPLEKELNFDIVRFQKKTAATDSCARSCRHTTRTVFPSSGRCLLNGSVALLSVAKMPTAFKRRAVGFDARAHLVLVPRL